MCYPNLGRKSKNVTPKKSSDKGQTLNQTLSKERKPRCFAPVCQYCKKPGHVMSDCWLLKKRGGNEAMPNAFASSKPNRGHGGRVITLLPATSEVASCGKADSCLPLVGSLQYRTLTNCIYWFPLPFQLPIVI